MGSRLNGLRAAISFLTRIPAGEVEDDWLPHAPAWFPTVGAALGAIVGAGYMVVEPVVGAWLAAVAVVGLSVLLTGGFHEDGLADTADSFGSGATGDRALEIMRDSRLGTYGMLALALAVLWRVVAIASLETSVAFVALMMAGALARTGVVVMMNVSPAARPDSVGRQMVLGASSRTVFASVSSGLVVGGLAGGWWVIPAVVVIVPVVWWMRRASIRKVGGVTGDILGATEQLSELAVLALCVALANAGYEVWWA